MANLLTNINNFINKDLLGIDNKPTSLGGSAGLPWSVDPKINKNEIFWPPIDIKSDRWDKLYPYRLLVVDVTGGGRKILTGKASSKGNVANSKTAQSGIEYIITQYNEAGKWEMVLPITPQQLQIQDRFAINLSATMRGVVEEHNGVKFKMINMSGTTGIWPKKPTIAGSINNPTTLAGKIGRNIGSVFGGTLQAATSFIGNVNNVLNVAQGKHANSPPKADEPGKTNAGEFSTGYWQAMFLGQFLERYAELKKDPNNNNLRLVFDIPKQNQSFVVSPISFSMNQSQQKPNEMLFSAQLKAWHRIDLKATPNAATNNLPTITTDLYQDIVRTLGATRSTLSSANNLLKAVRGDFQHNIWNIIRQTTLAIKDGADISRTASDLPKQLVADYKSTIENSLFNKNYFNTQIKTTPYTASTSGINSSGVGDSQSTAKGGARAQDGGAINDLISNRRLNEGLSRNQIENGALGDAAIQKLQTNPIDNIFDNPNEHFDLFDNISLDSLTLTPKQKDLFEEELAKVRILTINDFREYRQELLKLVDDIANNYGASDSTYAQIYNLQTPKIRSVPLSVQENEVMESLFNAIQAYDALIATKQYDDLNIENPLEYVGGLADEAGIDFETFPSKQLQPVPFGLTIEEIAARYLEDSNKWIEIVTLNNLRSPYIDEDGFELSLLSNAQGRQFNIDNSNNQFFVGQKIILQSLIVPPFSRKITDIEKIGDNNYLITVDGLANLDILTLSDQAKVKGFLPGTVNSQNQIYIPVNLPAQLDDRTFEIPNLNNPNLTKISKVDFLLTDNFDVAINSVGDFRLANGLTNLVQALKMKIRTKKGTLLRHLDFGLGINYGISVADVENGIIIDEMNQMIKSDDRFDFIEKIDITLKAPTLTVDMVISLANDTGVVPITFSTRL